MDTATKSFIDWITSQDRQQYSDALDSIRSKGESLVDECLSEGWDLDGEPDLGAAAAWLEKQLAK